jgi:hypothetical protein
MARGRKQDPVDRLRTICLELPEATERVSHGSPSFFVGKQFVSVDDHHHGVDHLAFWCPAPPGAQEALIAADPERYFRPPYVGHRGWVGMRIDTDPDWDEVAEQVTEAYRMCAPKRLVARLESDSDTPPSAAGSGHLSPADRRGRPAPRG